MASLPTRWSDRAARTDVAQGLGKTIQTIAMLAYLKEFKSITGPHIIITPKSTLANWMKELELWFPCATAVRFHGSEQERVPPLPASSS
jgi:SNF2 family DNA or RNA helicase